MKIQQLRVLVPLLAFAMVPCSGLAEVVDIVVASDGVIHKLQQGLYSDLFPGGYDAEPTSSVLALDVVHGGSSERFLVPATEDPYAETPVALHYERNSGTTYVLWKGLVNGLHPFLPLAGFDGFEWSKPIDITGNVFADKASADLIILSEPEGAGISLAHSPSPPMGRSVIYVAWQEVTSTETQKYLVPIILQGGVYLGWHKSFQLSKFLPEEPEAKDSEVPIDDGVENLLRIQPSARANSVVVGFTNPGTRRLVTLEVEMLPQALSTLAEYVESQIRQYAETSSSVSELADKVRDSILAYDQDFHRSTLIFLADEIRDLLLENSTVAAAIAPGIPEKFGIHIIHAGARVRSKGLLDIEPREIIQMGQSPEGGGPYHYLKVSILADREIPEVGTSAVLFLSSTGLEALVAWEEEGEILFRETSGIEWSEPQMIALSAGLDKQSVYRILANRTLNR